MHACAPGRCPVEDRGDAATSWTRRIGRPWYARMWGTGIAAPTRYWTSFVRLFRVAPDWFFHFFSLSLSRGAQFPLELLAAQQLSESRPAGCTRWVPPSRLTGGPPSQWEHSWCLPVSLRVEDPPLLALHKRLLDSRCAAPLFPLPLPFPFPFLFLFLFLFLSFPFLPSFLPSLFFFKFQLYFPSPEFEKNPQGKKCGGEGVVPA